MMVSSFEITYSNFCVFVRDQIEGIGKPKGIDTSDIWDYVIQTDDSADFPERMEVAAIPNFPELFVFSTARIAGIVQVELEIVPAPRLELPGEDWKLAGPVELNVPTGKLVISGPEDPHGKELGSAVVSIPPARYNGMVVYTGIDQVEDELDETGPDRYRVILWPVGEA